MIRNIRCTSVEVLNLLLANSRGRMRRSQREKACCSNLYIGQKRRGESEELVTGGCKVEEGRS